MTQDVKFWQGTNFWLAIVLAFGGLFVGFPEGAARNTVGAIFALVSGAGAIREFVKGAKVDVKAWIGSVNTWNYLGAALMAIFPMLTPELFTSLSNLANAVISGNLQGIVTAVLSLGTILYYIFVKPKPVSA